MQVIEVKFLPVTAHKPARLKAFTTGGKYLVESFKSSDPLECKAQARRLAEKLITKQWGRDVKISGQGTLRNGNEVFTIERM